MSPLKLRLCVPDFFALLVNFQKSARRSLVGLSLHLFTVSSVVEESVAHLFALKDSSCALFLVRVPLLEVVGLGTMVSNWVVSLEFL